MLKARRIARKKRTKAKLVGTKDRPRLSVFRSNKAIYAQVIDDSKGHTMVNARGVDAAKVGQEIAKMAAAKKVKSVVFDRGGYKYHGKVKDLAENARKGGLVF